MSPEPPLITIVTVCKNSQETILDTLESVASQSLERFEYIIRDGGSTDSTVRTIKAFLNANKEFASRVTFQSALDRGMYDALNMGYESARGEYIGILNADDVLSGPDVLADLVCVMTSKGPQMIYGDLVYVDRASASRVIRTWSSGPFRADAVRSGWMPPHPTVYLKRDLIECMEGYRLDLKVAADYEFLVRLMDQLSPKDVVYLEKPLVRMRVGGVSNQTASLARVFYEDCKALRFNNYGIVQAVVIVIKKKLSKLAQYR